MNFFISYRKTKLKKGQFISSIRIPIFKKNIFKAYKISKRIDDDISSVCASFNLAQSLIKKLKILKLLMVVWHLFPKEHFIVKKYF